ncbi:RidA family protein [Maribacter luteus]|uniref:RidA family protein n=1 Tax=Maribacter luteus TaxID=2594478 RepID=A0A6I2MLK3_9FLAO|nr:RidA family protein [Maribacter luteus]MRX64691.1 RidA family protein [Maribacter luteus]
MQNKENTFINPTGLFNPLKNGFSHIVKIPKGKDLYFFSGQWASDDKGQLVSQDFGEQVRKTVSNVKTAMEAAGITIIDVVKQTVYIADFTLEKKNILIEVASKEWETENFPASTIVPVSILATAKDCLIEIELIAAK